MKAGAASPNTVRRAFVDIEQGQIHCRMTGDRGSDCEPPLLMLHGGPGSSAGLLPMIAALAAQGLAIVAPDMMGNGQSDPPPSQPDIGFYADCVLATLDRLGIERVDCYGHHVGAQIACELAIRAPDRVRRLVLDGIGLFTADHRQEFLARYAPPIQPDPAGDHLRQLWDFLSNTTRRFPHYSEAATDRIAGGTALPPAVLTDLLADVARNWRTYHLSYRAGFSEDVATRLPMVTQPTVVLDVAGDPLARYAATAATLLPNAVRTSTDRAGRADAILQTVKPQPR